MQLCESINAFYKYLLIKCYIVIFLYKNKKIKQSWKYTQQLLHFINAFLYLLEILNH